VIRTTRRHKHCRRPPYDILVTVVLTSIKMNKFVLFSVCLCALVTMCHGWGLTQSTRAVGRVFCGTEPAANVRVVLTDKDTGIYL
jgi:hypothetical protein